MEEKQKRFESNNLPYKVLGIYKPESSKCFKIGKELTEFTKRLGFIPFKNDEIKRNSRAAWVNYDLHAEVRRTAIPGSEGTTWHQDGDTSTSHMDCALVLWAERDGTEFKVNDKIYQCKPYEVIIARNLSCYHRRNPEVSGIRRSFRQRVEVPKKMNLL